MRRATAFVALLALSLAMGQCGRPPTSSEDGPASPTGILGQNLLVQASGDLAYKRPGWKDYLPLTFGIGLVRGDLLEVAVNGEGLLVCADLSVAPLEPGYVGGVPCPSTNEVLTRGDSLVIAPQRGASATDSIPILLQPRHTFVRDANPLIRWAPSGAPDATYTVRVWGGDVDWRGQAIGSELRYPDEAPPLAPGSTYRVTVTDDAGRSSDEEATALDLGFALLSADEIAAVDALVQQTRDLNLNDEGTRLVEAEVLIAHGLRADAIAMLAGFSDQGDAPTVVQRLGEQYLEIGLYSEARQHYQAALTGFQRLGNRALEAAALTGLGLAQRGDNDEASARESLEQARQLYQDLGDTEDVGRVEQVLEDLGNE